MSAALSRDFPGIQSNGPETTRGSVEKGRWPQTKLAGGLSPPRRERAREAASVRGRGTQHHQPGGKLFSRRVSLQGKRSLAPARSATWNGAKAAAKRVVAQRQPGGHECWIWGVSLSPNPDPSRQRYPKQAGSATGTTGFRAQSRRFSGGAQAAESVRRGPRSSHWQLNHGRFLTGIPSRRIANSAGSAVASGVAPRGAKFNVLPPLRPSATGRETKREVTGC